MLQHNELSPQIETKNLLCPFLSISEIQPTPLQSGLPLRPPPPSQRIKSTLTPPPSASPPITGARRPSSRPQRPRCGGWSCPRSRRSGVPSWTPGEPCCWKRRELVGFFKKCFFFHFQGRTRRARLKSTWRGTSAGGLCPPALRRQGI